MNYLYSVVIPHYNNASLLNRMLESIPLRDDIQIIVVDDKSNEENIKLLKCISRDNLKVVFLNENHGAGYARNIGLNYVFGDWLIVVDSDDVFAPNAFDVFDQNIKKQIDYLGFCCKCVDTITLKPNGLKVRSDEAVRKYLSNRTSHNLMYFKYLNTECWNKLVSTKFLKDNNISFEDCQVNNDVLYALEVSYYANTFEVIPDELYYFANNANSITTKKRSVEREFLFYIQAQKRNGFYKQLGLKRWPFYRHDILYVPFIIKKHGFAFAISFFMLYLKNRQEIKKARNAYMFLFER